MKYFCLFAPMSLQNASNKITVWHIYACYNENFLARIPQATHTYEFLIIKKWIFHLALITYELDESKSLMLDFFAIFSNTFRSL